MERDEGQSENNPDMTQAAAIAKQQERMIIIPKVDLHVQTLSR